MADRMPEGCGRAKASCPCVNSCRRCRANALTAASSGGPTKASDRYDPRFNDFRYVDSSANSNYHGLRSFIPF